MATADKLVNLADLKTAYDTTVRHDAAQELTLVQQRTARDNIGAADAHVTGIVIDPLTYWTTDGTASLVNHSLTRTDGDLYKLNTNTSASSTSNVYFKLSGNLGAISTANGATSWSSVIELEEGVPYTLTVTPISGTLSANVYVRLYSEDTSVGSGLSTAAPYVNCLTGGSVSFVWGDATKKAKIILWIAAATVADNFTFRLTLAKTRPIDHAITVGSSTPTITGVAGCRYTCTATAVTELTFTPPEKGLCAVRFTSGSTATVLTLPNTVKMPSWWTGPEASRTYEISFEDGYGVVTSWA